MKKLIFGVVLFLGVQASARNVVQVTMKASSSAASRSEARREIFDKVVKKASERYISQLVGAQKLQENKAVIESEIVANSEKYILIRKGGEITKKDGSVTMPVTLKLSLESLNELLLEQGLLYKLEGPPKVLPVISFEDRVNSQSLNWWSQGSGPSQKMFLKRHMERFHQVLRQELQSRGFFSLQPIEGQFHYLVPTVFEGKHPPTEDYLFLGQFFRSQIVVKGQILVDESTDGEGYVLQIKLVALHSGNGRVVGEIIREYQTPPLAFQEAVQKKLGEVQSHMARDLTVQIHDAWKSGTFGANLLRLTVHGRLDYKHMQQFKEQLVAEVAPIKTLKERLFKPGQVVFEMDASNGASQVAKALRSTQFSGFKVEVSQIKTQELDLHVSQR